jgi:hypothetical protein
LPAAAARAEGGPASRPKKIQITVSKETTYLLGPRNADGAINYVAAANRLQGEGVTPANNAAVLVIRALGPTDLEEATRPKLLRKLGIKALPPKGKYFVSASEYIQGKYPDARPDDRRRRIGKLESPRRGEPVPPGTRPDLAGWVRRNATILALLVAASHRPRFFVPWVSPSQPPNMLEGPGQFTYVRLNGACYALNARAMLRGGSGDLDAAIPDLLALRRLGRLIAQRGLYIDELIGLGIDKMAVNGIQGLAASGKLNAHQARRLLDAMGAPPSPPDPPHADKPFEQFFALDAIMLIARKGLDAAYRFPGLSDPKEPRIPNVELDIDEFLRLTNKRWRDARAADAKPTFAERAAARAPLDKIADPDVAALVKQQQGMLSMRRRLCGLIERVGTRDRRRLTRAIEEMLSKGSGLSILHLGNLRETERFRPKVVRLAVALEPFRCQRGHYPAALAALVPRFVKSVPNDLFSDKPLIYRRTEKGYVLYSVGPNMADDDGRKEYDRGKDDIAVRVER